MMGDHLHYNYPMGVHYPQSVYVAQQQPVQSQMSMTSLAQTAERPQRKRPKYTRSKTGCLTCRAKKVKCDEEKPDCARCRAGRKECVWPDPNAPSRRRTGRHDIDSSQSPSLDARPSTAGSSGFSDASSPPTRENTPAKAEPVEYTFAHGMSTQPSGVYVHASRGTAIDPRQQMHAANMQTYISGANGQMMSNMPQAYQQHSYHSHHTSMPHAYQQATIRGVPQSASHPTQQLYQPTPVKVEDTEWRSQSISDHVDPLQPFFPVIQQQHDCSQQMYYSQHQ